jgi:hypothetical protein
MIVLTENKGGRKRPIRDAGGSRTFGAPVEGTHSRDLLIALGRLGLEGGRQPSSKARTLQDHGFRVLRRAALSRTSLWPRFRAFAARPVGDATVVPRKAS